MDKSELIFHLTVNTLIALLIYVTIFLLGYFHNIWYRILAAIVGARTLNYFLNDHFWGGLLVSFPFVKNCGTEKIRGYLINSAKRLSKCDSIFVCTVYGSIVRNEFHDKSDLDVRYIRKSGFLNATSALSFAVRERIIAVFTQIPLDLYVGDTVNFLKKMRDDEPPIIIKDRDGSMVKKYASYIPFEKFLQNFRHNKDRGVL